MRFQKLITILIFSIFFVNISYSQINITTDVVSRYIYRGNNSGGNSAHIEPTINYNINKSFQISAFSTYGISNNYEEIDLSVKYTIKKLSISLSDNYNPISSDGKETSSNINILNYNTNSTTHQIEVILNYTISDKVPLSFTVESYFYGNDKNSNNSNYYSTYLEVAYSTNINDYTINTFAGMTPKQGMFGDKTGFMNIGMKVNKSIKITNNYKIPVYEVLYLNTISQKLYFVIGVTIY